MIALLASLAWAQTQTLTLIMLPAPEPIPPIAESVCAGLTDGGTCLYTLGGDGRITVEAVPPDCPPRSAALRAGEDPLMGLVSADATCEPEGDGCRLVVLDPDADSDSTLPGDAEVPPSTEPVEGSP